MQEPNEKHPSPYPGSDHTRQKRILTLVWVVLIAMTLLSLILFLFITRKEVEKFLPIFISILSMIFSLILFAFILFYDYYESKKEKIFLVAVLFTYGVQFLTLFQLCFQGNKTASYISVPIETACCLLSIGINFLFWMYQAQVLPPSKMRHYLNNGFYVLGLFNIVVYIVNLFTGFFFHVDGTGYLIYDHAAIEILPMVLFFVLYLSCVFSSKESIKTKMILASHALFQILYLVLYGLFIFMEIDIICQPVPYTFLLFSQYLIFFFVAVEERESLLLEKAKAIEKDKLLIQKEKDNTELQMSMMLSQIQPHFLYNALTAIRSLCKTDPDQAYEALAHFADYLRMNMDSIGSEKLVPFEKELEHTQTYTQIEQMRFGDELKVIYNIEEINFHLPPLTLQPLVENAVRHGVCKNENGGTVTIGTKKAEGKIIIQVMDDGPGFDPHRIIPHDQKSHIGLENVRKRISSLMSGSLNIQSKPGCNTVISVTFPIENDE